MRTLLAILSLILPIALFPAAGAQSICEDSSDDISLFGIAGVDMDRDGQGKAVCVGNVGVNVDDKEYAPPGGYAVTVQAYVCIEQNCKRAAGETGGGAATAGGRCLLGGICPRAYVYLGVIPGECTSWPLDHKVCYRVHVDLP